jgi:hypothetical protein
VQPAPLHLRTHTVRTEVRDPIATAAACRRLGLPEPVHGTVTLFSAEAEGLLVKLPDWVYPVVVDAASGQLHYDNYKGAWGQQKHLDRFLQAYAVENSRHSQCTFCFASV